MDIFLVGGAVRDLLLGKLPHDFDYSFSGSVEDFLRLFPRAKKVGNDHSVFIVRGHEYSPLTGETILDDLRNRDLTINAFALSPEGKIHHLPESLPDLEAMVLRPCSENAFLNDPNRVFRLARFYAVYPGSRLAPQTTSLLKSFPKNLLATIAKERVAGEVLRALGCAHPDRFFTLLAEFGLLSPWFCELEAGETIPAGPVAYHKSSVFGHTMRVLHAVAGDVTGGWMALCHDLGKIVTPRDILPHHYHHEKNGMPIAEDFARRLGLSRTLANAGVLAARDHMLGGLFETLRPGKKRDLLWRVHTQGLDDPFWAMCSADARRDMKAIVSPLLATLTQVHLPEEFQNQGIISREKLRDLQIKALLEKMEEETAEN